MTDASSERQLKKQQTYRTLGLVRSDGQRHVYTASEALDGKDETDRANREKWEIILGLFLKDQLASKDIRREYKLKSLPDGFELRYVQKDTKKDYGLYGHPLGEKFKYRSPIEFFPHLIWLAGDSIDRGDCNCDFCQRLMERDKNKPRSQSIRASAPWMSTGLAMPASSAPAPRPSSAAPAASVPPVARVQTKVAKTSPVSSPASVAFLPPSSTSDFPGLSTAAPPAAPTYQPPSLSAPPLGMVPMEIDVDLPENAQCRPPPAPPGTTGLSNIFRMGEMVWFKHRAWRLGVITAIKTKDGHPAVGLHEEAECVFIVAPMAHTKLATDPVTKHSDEMRPFLTFSVPASQIPELADKSFDDVDWPSLVQRLVRDPDPNKRAMQLQMIGLEASKMAARNVNDSISVFNQVPNNHNMYKGAYLGAEMILLGDSLRVNRHEPSGGEVACVTLYVAGIRLDNGHTASTPSRRLLLSGSTYRLVRSGSEQGIVPVSAADLGPYFVEELAWRNQVDCNAGGPWTWSLVEANVEVHEADVLGRDYVMPKLMRQVDPVRFDEALARGELLGPQSCLNIRAHSGNGAARHMGLQDTRQKTFGQSIRERLIFSEGIQEVVWYSMN